MLQLCVYEGGACVYTTLAVQWHRYVQCRSHICSVIYVKHIYITCSNNGSYRTGIPSTLNIEYVHMYINEESGQPIECA